MSFNDDLINTVLKDLKRYAKTKFKEKAPQLLEYIDTFLIENADVIERW